MEGDRTVKAEDIFPVTGDAVGPGFQQVVMDKETLDTGQVTVEILRDKFGHDMGRWLLHRLVRAGRFVTLRARCKEVPPPSNCRQRVFMIDIKEHTDLERPIWALPANENTNPPVLQRIEARVASRLLGVLEEIMVNVEYPHLFRAYIDGKVVPVKPDSLVGYMDEIRQRFQKTQDWSLLDLARERE